MGDEFVEAVRFLRSSTAIPLWIMAIAVVGALVKIVPSVLATLNERLRDKAAARAGDWQRLREEIARLDERCQRIEEREEDCRRELAEAVRRIAELEGYQMGQGHARQEAANIVAAERLEDRTRDGGHER